MEISEHIKIMMAKFVEEFPEARVNYGYDKMANVHVIEILPLALYKSKAFKDWQWNSCEEFLTLYPSDEIGFISEDAVVPLEKVDFSVQGTQYGLAETKPRHKASARYYSENYSRSPVVCEGETPYEIRNSQCAIAAFRQARRIAESNPGPEMTLDEINEEIRAARKERAQAKKL